MGSYPLLLGVVVVVVVGCWSVPGVSAYTGRLLLVSMDGFRWDYINNISGLDNFARLKASGCSLEYVDPVFVTKTYPCHYSIATGLYPESHGLVANSMYDRERNASFTYRNRLVFDQPFWWDGAEPIWTTTTKNNISTATFFWPGTDALIGGVRPSISMPYNGSVPFSERVNTALHWLGDLGKDFVTLYFHEPDMTGHFHGPHSQQMIDKVREMDGILGQILDGMERRNLSDVVNIIVTSDHGMAQINMNDKLVDLWQYVNESLVDRVTDFGPVTAILPVAGREDEVLAQAQGIPNANAYRKADVPAHFHYSNNARIMPVIIIADEGWTVSTNATESRERNDQGNHGYSNELSSMKTIFFARGPDFRKGVHSQSIKSVDIYPLLCRLLGVEPRPNNGSAAATEHFLVAQNPPSSAGQQLRVGFGCLVMLMALAMASY